MPNNLNLHKYCQLNATNGIKIKINVSLTNIMKEIL